MDERLRKVPVECLALKSRMASRAVTRAYDEALRPIGLRITQFTILVGVRLGAPTSISAFAETLGLDRTTLIRNLDVLEREGLIRRSDEGYRRQRSIELTEAGEDKLAEAIPYWEQAQSEARKALGADPTEWDELGRLLGRVRQVD